MFISPAYAQGAGAPGGGDFLVSFVPIILLIAIFWFLIFRPQQKRMKAHRAMLDAIKRGDTVVTSGGIVGKVVKVNDGEDLEVEIAQGTRVKVVRSMVSDVRSKTEPVNDNTGSEPKKPSETKKPAASKSRSRSRTAKSKTAASESKAAETESKAVEAESKAVEAESKAAEPEKDS